MDVRELRKRGLIATSGSWWRHWLRWRALRYPTLTRTCASD
ncbi:hypothetical protein [Propionivibrio sp.]|nr:hypothetical protein [Propionivibrio sp.]